MRIELNASHILGFWGSCGEVSQCEFQFGQRLIYVAHPAGEASEPYLREVQSLVQAAWDDIEAVIAFTRETVRPGEPELWRLLESAACRGSPLEVFSIHIAAGNGTASYTLSWSPDFDWRQVVYDEFDTWKESPISLQRFEPKKDLWLSIKRCGAGRFEPENVECLAKSAQ
ncbi:hypothetical protein N5J43_24570 [Pseudomonas nicosulfuronedens]|uniref:Uncharacterized protein n=1 Tax=Pseudomonas nicosulfuronedens TaxID=2571105 RepID=A0A5R9QT21_9PSED|nr:hypothetical protein [Pseudomonas nicosulfuronedens]MDH1011365.1 hypothetical protein [Pseudomonas nicosulfuronedens]MDH1982140.1 hypothetical protein [Pseudomonas nicosulfuronedens]MDH2029683.1 hypothetical protein [Pseudomonas nicosulfuronedens]TLX72963.1 hypothetical protein FAS41_22140 [Pseudomonas nicosulfuronedens]